MEDEKPKEAIYEPEKQSPYYQTMLERHKRFLALEPLVHYPRLLRQEILNENDLEGFPELKKRYQSVLIDRLDQMVTRDLEPEPANHPRRIATDEINPYRVNKLTNILSYSDFYLSDTDDLNSGLTDTVAESLTVSQRTFLDKKIKRLRSNLEQRRLKHLPISTALVRDVMSLAKLNEHFLHLVLHEPSAADPQLLLNNFLHRANK